MRIFYALVSSFIDLTNANRHLSLKGNDMQFPLVFLTVSRFFVSVPDRKRKKRYNTKGNNSDADILTKSSLGIF